MERSVLHELVEAAMCGDPAAFGEIMALHERMVLRVAERMLPDPDDAKDIAQDVFLKLHRSLKQFEADKEVSPWLYRITVNACRDRMRRARKSVPLADADDVAVVSERDPEQSAAASQKRRMMMQALARLAPRERAAIVLRDLEGNSTREVAELLGSTEATVRSQLSTGRTKMRDFVLARLRARE